MSDPATAGARPKDTYAYKNQTKQMPNAGSGQPSDTAQGRQPQQAATLACPQTLYPSLEEKVVPAVSDRTKDWVHVSKFEDSWKEDLQQDNLDQKIQRSLTFDVASGQPPDYVQTMRTLHIGPQQTNLNQHGYGLLNPISKRYQQKEA